jgi:hypothetical protein
MKTHANARLSLKRRELLVDRVENAGWSPAASSPAARQEGFWMIA